MNTEIEARFLDIDVAALIEKLRTLGARDKGEVLLQEIIFYDTPLSWKSQGKFVRMRTSGEKTTLTYKENIAQTVDSAHEIEFDVSNAEQTQQFLVAVGLAPVRHQEKKRHTFTLDDVTIDIDVWPQIPAYVEFEGPSEVAIQTVAERVGYRWSDAIFDDARKIIETRYNLPVSDLKWFTFNRVE